MIQQRILLDANLLVLLIVGLTNPKFIAAHKRLASYSEGDFNILLDLLGPPGISSLIVTPNVLTEASNLLRHSAEPRKSAIMDKFRIFLKQVSEVHVPGNQAADRPEFLRLGLTDAALIELDNEEVMLLTADAPLYAAALTAGRHAENFAHHRVKQL